MLSRNNPEVRCLIGQFWVVKAFAWGRCERIHQRPSLIGSCGESAIPEVGSLEA